MQIVATFSQGDKKLQKDIKDVELHIQNNANVYAKFHTSKKSEPILTSEVYEDDDVMLKPFKTTIYKNENETPTIRQENIQSHSKSKSICNSDKNENGTPTIQQENIQSHSKTKTVCNIDKSFITNDNIIRNNVPKKITPMNVLKNIENIKMTLPQKPTSALEFERVCNSLKKNPNFAREYVKSIETNKYPTLFKESLSASIMQCFIYILRKGFMPNDPVVLWTSLCKF